jgi:hypothetical protein
MRTLSSLTIRVLEICKDFEYDRRHFIVEKKLLKWFQDLSYLKYLATEILIPISRITNPEFISLPLLFVLRWSKRIFN